MPRRGSSFPSAQLWAAREKARGEYATVDPLYLSCVLQTVKAAASRRTPNGTVARSYRSAGACSHFALLFWSGFIFLDHWSGCGLGPPELGVGLDQIFHHVTLARIDGEDVGFG